jgi:hypothetical protein
MTTIQSEQRHNHEWIWTEGYRPLGQCARCDFLRAAKAANGETPHNHEHMPFGRRVAGCPRCEELANGAAPREGYNDRQQRLDAERSAAIRTHYQDHDNTCPYMRDGAGVCVAFDW